MVGQIRSQILKLLCESGDWTTYSIAQELYGRRGSGESTVWKVTRRFRDCLVLEPLPPRKVPLPRRVLKDASGRTFYRSLQTFRTKVPCRITPLGRRLAKLIDFARTQGIFDIEPQRQRLADNPALLAKFEQAGFTEDEVKSAVKCGLIYEQPNKSYTPTEGFATPASIVSALGPQIRLVEYRYKYKIM